MKAFFGWVRKKLVLFVTYLVLLALTGGVVVYKQQSLIPGMNTYENMVINKVQMFHAPWSEAIDAPYATAVKIGTKLKVPPLRSARILTAAAYVLTVLMFFQLLRNWLLSPGKALVGTVLFATSSWALTLGRGAHSAMVGNFLLLLIFTLGTRVLFTTKPFFDWLALAIASALALYSPLVIWVIFLAGVVSLLHYKQRQRSLPLKLWHKIVIGIVTLVIVSPLVIACIRDPHQLLQLLGIEAGQEFSIPGLALNIAQSLKMIFFVGQPTPLTLGKLPMLDIFSVFMFLLGAYYFERRLSLKRSKLLYGGLVVGLVVCSLSGFDIMRLSLLLPLVYIFIAAGIHESISRWLAVFPRNPIARSLGVIMLAIAMGFTSSYHLHKVFLARPGNPEVRAFYQTK